MNGPPPTTPAVKLVKPWSNETLQAPIAESSRLLPSANLSSPRDHGRSLITDRPRFDSSPPDEKAALRTSICSGKSCTAPCATRFYERDQTEVCALLSTPLPHCLSRTRLNAEQGPLHSRRDWRQPLERQSAHAKKGRFAAVCARTRRCGLALVPAMRAGSSPLDSLPGALRMLTTISWLPCLLRTGCDDSLGLRALSRMPVTLASPRSRPERDAKCGAFGQFKSEQDS